MGRRRKLARRPAAEFVGAGNFVSGQVKNGLVQTRLGSFSANGSHAASAAEVLIRPEQLELAQDPNGDAYVVGREFRGHDVFYRLLLDGLELVSHRPSTELVEVGDRVSIRLHDRSASIFS